MRNRMYSRLKDKLQKVWQLLMIGNNHRWTSNTISGWNFIIRYYTIQNKLTQQGEIWKSILEVLNLTALKVYKINNKYIKRNTI
jgi:hypothetical protein